MTPSQVLVTNGGKQAVYQAFATLLDPGDEVILPGAVLDDLPGGDRAGRWGPGRGRRPTRRPDYLVTVEQLEAARTAATKALLSARPPTRPAPSTPASEIEAIGRWAVEHGIWVVTDEIYEHLVYDGAEFASMPVAVPELADTVRRAQRRRQDLRDDGVAGRLDGRPARRDQGGDEPAVAT